MTSFTNSQLMSQDTSFPSAGSLGAEANRIDTTKDCIALSGRLSAPDYDNHVAGDVHAKGYQIKLVRDFEDMAKVFAIRASACFDDPEHLYSKHFDGSDFCSTHLIGFVDGEPVGTIRIRYFAGFTRIERLCIRPTHRKSRISFKLAKAAFAFCRDKGYREMSGVAREELVPFWAMLGFKIDESKEPIFIYGLPHFEMKLLVEPAPDAVTNASHPMVLLRPEGRWMEAGRHETINATKPTTIDTGNQPSGAAKPRDLVHRMARKRLEQRQSQKREAVHTSAVIPVTTEAKGAS
jgi:predicted GNAT family N-acyltransferase